MKTPAPDASSAWWSQTRAVLARAFGAVQVRQGGLETPELGNAVRASEATRWPAPASGAQEHGRLLSASTHAWQPPAVQQGGGGLDAAALPCVVSGNGAVFLADSGVYGGEIGLTAPSVQAVDIGRELGGAGTVLPLAVSLTGGQACSISVSLLAPPVRAVPLALPGGSRAGSVRDGRGGVPAFRAPRTFSRLALITRVPLLRHRTRAPAGADTAKHFAAEIGALAAACGSSAEEVVFLASFACIPLALVQQMAVTPDGEALRLWMRPEALAAGTGWTAARVTIALGRRRQTGETVRAVLPEVRAAGRKQ